MQQPNRPIVIKRGPRVRAVRHGGAWKLAYADFMTAMMAFFLLMWLLGSVNPTALSGIADYFKTPLKAALQNGGRAGDNAGILQGSGGSSGRSNGGSNGVDNAADRRRDAVPATPHAVPATPRIVPAVPPVIAGAAAPATHPAPVVAARPGSNPIALPFAEADAADDVRLRALKDKLESALAASPTLRAFHQQIMLDLTREGLRVQILDTGNRPMFANASAAVEPYMRDILREIGRSLNEVPNHIVLSGHTDAHPYAGGERGYSNWELSADRANASRRELVAGGMDEAKILRVMGLGSTQTLAGDDPLAAPNRRITVVVLTHRAERAMRREQERAASVAIDETGSGPNPGMSPSFNPVPESGGGPGVAHVNSPN